MRIEDERLVFSSNVEALLLRGLAGRITPELRAGLKGIGFDLDKPLLPGYPSADWQRAVSLCCRMLYPDRSEDAAQFLLGERTVYGLEETLVGKAQIALARIAGPRRTLARIGTTARGNTNFSTLTVKELSPNEFEVYSEPNEAHPRFLAGAIVAAITIAGGKSVEVRIVDHDRVTEKTTLRATFV